MALVLTGDLVILTTVGRRHQDHSYCPLCGKHGNKFSRILQCRDEDAIERVIERAEGPLTKALYTSIRLLLASRLLLLQQFYLPGDEANVSQLKIFQTFSDYKRQ